MSGFGENHLPLGVFHHQGSTRVGSALGHQVIDLGRCGLEISDPGALYQPSLNRLLSLGKSELSQMRVQLRQKLGNLPEPALIAMDEVEMRLPVQPGDFVDFYSSIYHATNVGVMFRGPERALNPNWKHLPVGYHGRCSTLQVSGHTIPRPWGQLPTDEGPVFAASRRIDFELEMGFVICGSTRPGETVSVERAEDYIYGISLVNDWSARDIQKWEYVPLGPFLGKSFATTISPWITPLEALEDRRIEGEAQVPQPLPHLRRGKNQHFDLPLVVEIAPAAGEPVVVCRSNLKHLYWSMAQQLAHLTSNGTALRAGDLCASGTISGPDEGSFGSLLELSWNGERPVAVGSQTRVFLEDGDTVTLSGGSDQLELGRCSATLVASGER